MAAADCRNQDAARLISFNMHPDYLNTPRARNTYEALLQSLVPLRSEADVWIPLPQRSIRGGTKKPNEHCSDGGGWRVEGAGAERATVAYAAWMGIASSIPSTDSRSRSKMACLDPRIQYNRSE